MGKAIGMFGMLILIAAMVLIAQVLTHSGTVMDLSFCAQVATLGAIFFVGGIITDVLVQARR